MRGLHCTAEGTLYECSLERAPQQGIRVFALETAAWRYGFILIGIGDGGDLARHEELLTDFGRAVAICLENRWQKERMNQNTVEWRDEEGLREPRFPELAESTGVGYFLVDREGWYRQVNDGCDQIRQAR